MIEYLNIIFSYLFNFKFSYILISVTVYDTYPIIMGEKKSTLRLRFICEVQLTNNEETKQ